MQSSCVSCHNTHPDSPKKDWKVGDVRGVLEIITPLDRYINQTRKGLSGLTALLGTMAVLALSGIAVVIGRLRNLSTELEQQVSLRTSELRQTNQYLSVEKRRSEHLLLNILPSPIATRLKQGNKPIADGFASATVLFADLVNFTQLSEQLAPRQLVALLNEVFSRFDRLTEQYGLEKIKTIGDAYMVVGGLPKPTQDHAQAIAEMALAMRSEMDCFNQQRGLDCKIRIGINTGPVVAGVIGTKKFIYDLWGDTVNVASRMESHGIVGQIQVTESTYACLRGQYDFEARGPIEIKGKGELPVYLLKGHKSAKLVGAQAIKVIAFSKPPRLTSRAGLGHNREVER
jgi:adenylate cyclase